MPWIQLTVHSSAHQADAVADLLEKFGALAVTFSDSADQPIFEPALGTTPLWQQTTITGLFTLDADLRVVLKSIRQLYPDGLPPYSQHTLEDQDWERTCLDQFHAMRYGQRLWVVPSWQVAPDPTATNILLDPGLAFGTGTHPTTALCLEWLESYPLGAQMTLLDFGCGSGILAIAAVKLGVARASAVDIDPQALTASKQNADNNACLDKITLYYPNQLPAGVFNIVMANILAEPLLQLAEDLAAKVCAGGAIVLSGILKNQAQQVYDRYSLWFELDPIARKDDWVRISGTKSARKSGREKSDRDNHQIRPSKVSQE